MTADRTVTQLLTELRESGIQVWVEDQQLRVRAAKGQLTGELRAQLATRKPDILAFLGTPANRVPDVFAPIPQANREASLPLSFAQERLWFLAEYEPASTAYGIFLASRLAGALDVTALERSLGEVLHRHEVLRTTFAVRDGKPLQIIAAPGRFQLEVVDLSAVPAAEREAEARRRLAGRCQQGFDLATGPLFDAVLLRLEAGTHWLLVRVHHVAFDGWSVGVLQRELSALYTAFHQGRTAALTPPAIQYADFAVWQRGWLQGPELDRQLAYWRSQLQGITPLELPQDQPRPATLSGQGAVHRSHLSSELAARLRTFIQAAKATPFMGWLAAFNVLLARYSGAEDIVVGTPIANRTRLELEEMIGFFVNTLAVRCKLAGNPSFRELVTRVRRTALEAFQHQDLPFEKLVAELNPVREQNRHPLFQVVLAVQNTPNHPLALPGLEVSPCPLPVLTTRFDLELHLWPEGDGWLAEWIYNPELFDAATVARMAGHYEILLDHLLAEPDRPIMQAPMLAEAERRQLLVEWNQTRRAYPREQCVHELFAAQAERTPEAVAVEGEGRPLTYRELDAQSNQLAHHLRQAGVAAGTLAAVCLDRSPAMVVAWLAILKAGGAYVPLDASYPAARLQFMLQDTASPVLVTQERWRTQFAGLGVQMLCLDTLAMGDTPNGAGAATGAASDAAYVIYTSGSTGQPKGVVVPHRAINRLVCNTDYVEFGSDVRIAQIANAAFDAVTFEVWGALLNGGTVVIIPQEVLLSPPDLAATLRQRRITSMFITAALFNQVVREIPEAFAPLREVLAGGEALDPHAVRAVLQSQPPRRLLNGYGPTEVTTFTTWHLIESVGARASSVPIGRPIGNTTVYILDAHGQPVPVGVPGELYAGGDGVATGYLHQPQLTAERFVADPFCPGPGARLYRTGDRARWRADGTIECLGRLDQQVKVRGFRIELGEIESMLAAHAAVAACAVTVQGRHAEKSLAAFLVARNGAELAPPALRAWLAERLPDYLIPAHFIVLTDLPLTPNGKVDRRALDRLETPGRVAGEDYVAPRTELERQLAGLWEQALGRRPIGVRDNFFSLGGHSLQAVRLAAEMDKLLGHKLPIAVLFQAPTIELVAQWLVAKDWAPKWSSLVPLQPLGSQPPLFLVHGWGGDVFGFLNLVKLLPPDQPVYGIQAVGLDGKAERHFTVEAMAAHYADEIIAFQPAGPFYVSGYSLGGVIAYEAARQLQRRGRAVALLVLFDSMPLGKIPFFTYSRLMAPILWNRSRVHMRRWWQMPLQDRVAYFRGRWQALHRRLGHNRTQGAPLTAPPPPGSQAPQVPGFKDYYHAITAAYQPGPYPGAMEVIVSEETAPEIEVWKFLAQGGAVFHRIPGGHHDIVLSPEYLPGLAKALTTVLQQVQSKTAGTPNGAFPVGEKRG